jgi:hypothetical protein
MDVRILGGFLSLNIWNTCYGIPPSAHQFDLVTAVLEHLAQSVKWRGCSWVKFQLSGSNAKVQHLQRRSLQLYAFLDHFLPIPAHTVCVPCMHLKVIRLICFSFTRKFFPQQTSPAKFCVHPLSLHRNHMLTPPYSAQFLCKSYW